MNFKKIKITKPLVYKTVAILALTGAFIFLGLVVNERRQFNAAERQIDDLHAKIVNAVGQPAQEIKDKSCGFSSAKSGKGRLSCRVLVALKYDVDDHNSANSILLKVTRESKSPIKESLYGNNETSFTEVGKNDQLFVQNMDTNNGCHTEYQFPILTRHNGIFIPDVNKSSLAIYLVCSEYSLLEYFPVRN